MSSASHQSYIYTAGVFNGLLCNNWSRSSALAMLRALAELPLQDVCERARRVHRPLKCESDLALHTGASRIANRFDPWKPCKRQYRPGSAGHIQVEFGGETSGAGRSLEIDPLPCDLEVQELTQDVGNSHSKSKIVIPKDTVDHNEYMNYQIPVQPSSSIGARRCQTYDSTTKTSTRSLLKNQSQPKSRQFWYFVFSPSQFLLLSSHLSLLFFQ
jgi:hypothetical protein